MKSRLKKPTVALAIVAVLLIIVAGYFSLRGPQEDESAEVDDATREPVTEETREPAIIEDNLEAEARFMGQAIEERAELYIDGWEEEAEELSKAGMAVGEEYLAFLEGSSGTLVFLAREDLQQVDQLKTAQDFDVFSLQQFFWGDHLVVLSEEIIAIYGMEEKAGEERLSILWEQETNHGEAELAAVSGKKEHLVVYDREQGEMTTLEILQQENGEIYSAWQHDEDWSVSDVAPYEEDKLLVTSPEKGWMFLDLRDFSIEKLDVGGPQEVEAWEELNRVSSDNGKLDYRLEGVDEHGNVAASVSGRVPAEERDINGTFKQLWVPWGDSMVLLAENFAQHVEGGPYWSYEEDSNIYTSFDYHPGSSLWLNRGSAGEIDDPEGGGSYSALQLDEDAVMEALEEGRYGGDARLDTTDLEPSSPSETLGEPTASLSRFFQVQEGYGYLSHKHSELDLLSLDEESTATILGRSDGVYLLEGGEQEPVRVAGAGLNLGAIDKKEREVYFWGQGKLFRLSYEELTNVEKQTIYPSPDTDDIDWSVERENDIIYMTLQEDTIYYLEGRRQDSYIRAVDKHSGAEKWSELLEGSPRSEEFNVLNNRVKFVDGENNLQMLNAETGEIEQELSLAIDDLPRIQLIADDYLYASERADEHDLFYALDYETGERAWELEAEKRVGDVTLLDGNLYVGDGDLGEGNLYILDSHTGEVLDEFDTGIAELVSPIVKDGLLYSLGHGEGEHVYLYALDLDTGEMIWEYDLGHKAFPAQPVVIDDTIYAVRFGYALEDGDLVALHRHSGDKKWVNKQFSFASAPVEYDGIIYISDLNRYQYAVDAETGGIVWKYNPKVALYLPPGIYGGYPLSGVVGEEKLFWTASHLLKAIELD